ncbi:TRAFAC clade GTPase domain-containing protein [Paraburkholderia adhaesiva]|uniref:TRAFAC clade GTPase domain-containing protein n=1 Tax=Paraburkholderia adhaesiva TaxID=2883244 RepID=UPI001F40ED1B|nr:hypothetical protein [Paraburkholderia adhaesiva]
MDTSAFECRVPGCGGPRSGICINELSFKECPDVVPVAEKAEEIAQGTQPDAKAHAARSMAGTGIAASLDVHACDRLLRERGGIVVGIAAGPETGKTTMIATIYELLHRGRLAGYRFAGSETLRGYEERCHLARIASNGDAPDTPRTPRAAQLNFTHLRIATRSGIRDLIFSDRSGEHFDTAVDQPVQIGEFAELGRADVILLLIDLHHLEASPHVCISYARRLLMAMHQGGVLDGKVVRLVGTKADKLKAAGALEKSMATLLELATDLSRRTKGSVQVIALVTASRKQAEGGEIGQGLTELIDNVFGTTAPRLFQLTKIFPSAMTELDTLMLPYWDKRS